MTEGHRPELEANRLIWDELAGLHAASPFYDLAGFRAGRDSLLPFEHGELGDVTGARIVHLQCHVGLDTLSWARAGAEVVGIDFSEPALAIARDLAGELGVDARFVCSEIAEAARRTDELGTFDIVYTGKGALCWLPDLERWADTVVALLRPGGRLYLVEFHPLHEILADDDLRAVSTWLGSPRHTVDAPGSYATDAATVHQRSHEWSHGLAEMVTVLATRRLTVEFICERPTIAWKRWPFLVPATGDPDTPNWWTMPPHLPKLPLSYSLMARA